MLRAHPTIYWTPYGKSGRPLEKGKVVSSKNKKATRKGDFSFLTLGRGDDWIRTNGLLLRRETL